MLAPAAVRRTSSTGWWWIEVLFRREPLEGSAPPVPLSWRAALKLQQGRLQYQEESFHALLRRQDGTHFFQAVPQATFTLCLNLQMHVPQWYVTWLAVSPSRGTRRRTDAALVA